MSYLMIGAAVVSVKQDTGTMEWPQIGDSKRADDGTLHTTVRGWKREWEFTTDLSLYDAEAFEAALQATPPLSCSGDALGGTTLCHAVLKSGRDVLRSGGVYRIISFRLREQ